MGGGMSAAFILFVWVSWGNSTDTSSIKFADQAACEAARTVLTARFFSQSMYAVCFAEKSP